MSITETGRMADILQRQRAAFTTARPEALAVRKDRLKRIIAMMEIGRASCRERV